jgi:hypothetical protein
MELYVLTILVLIGGKDAQHTHTDIVKLADFGVSLRVPERPDDPTWLDRVGVRGTNGWIPPVSCPPIF